MHLLKTENEHVEIHELRGFVSENLVHALNEIYAVSRGTRSKKFLFSVSLNPPPQENVSTQVFERAITRVEEEFGLRKQSRAIVFHDKKGRRHCHAVWSRIDTQSMTAIKLPYFKIRLKELSRSLYIENNWQMPLGYTASKKRNSKNITFAQWQQAKRLDKDPREIRAVFQDCWAISDNKARCRNFATG